MSPGWRADKSSKVLTGFDINLSAPFTWSAALAVRASAKATAAMRVMTVVLMMLTFVLIPLSFSFVVSISSSFS